MTTEYNSSGGTPRLHIRELKSVHGGPYALDVAAGECVAILGASGSGKSVFLRMIADLDPNTGEVSVDGRMRDACPAPEWRRNVIYQAAEPAWWEATGGAHFSCAEKPIALELMQQLGLDPSLLDNQISRLSTGERQRLALVRSLARRPKALLLDEPTASLDQASTMAVEALLRGCLRDGLALVMVTHSAEQAQRMSDRMLRMHDKMLEEI
jgi:ABC-type iron transport system FetAB ATPase subunit